MKFLPKLTPRTALFIAAGILAYIALATYHGNLKEYYSSRATGQHSGDVVRLQQRAEAYKQQIAAARAEATAAEKEKKHLSKDLARAQAAAKKERVEELHKKITELKGQLSRQSQAEKAIITSQENKLAKYDILITSLQEKSDRANTKLASLREGENAASQQLLQKLKSQERELHTLLQRKTVSSKELRTTQQNLIRAQASVAKLKKSRQNVEGQLKVLRQEKEKSRQSLEGQLNVLRQEKEQSQHNANIRIADLITQLEQSKTQTE
ncbi:MAG: hypothetical protein D3923_08500, partial [Candidatus Electrothrix sp. AR3]|nr:hypothetical protein [Candidatus Electrothrix sp. AR3]